MINVLVIGAGMYVSGAGTDGCGTILPALLQNKNEIPLGKITLTSRTEKSATAALKKWNELSRKLEKSASLTALPEKTDNPAAYQEAISSGNFHCAIISVPDHLHYEIAKYCIESGLHVLVVKPLTPTVPEALELIKLTQKNKVYGAVEFHKRYDESNLKLKSLYEQGAIGKPLFFHIHYSQRQTVPLKHFSSWVEDTNIFQYLGVHYVDLISFITGYIPARVMAHGTDGFLKSQNIKAHDSITTMVEWKHPETGEIFSSVHHTHWVDPDTSPAMSDQRIRMVGTNGTIECDQKDRGIRVLTEEKGLEHLNPYFSDYLPNPDGVPSFSGYGEKSIRTFLEDVSLIVDGKKSPGDFEGIRPTFTAALPSTAVSEAATRSLQGDNSWILPVSA